jgi:hypothetical protein
MISITYHAVEQFQNRGGSPDSEKAMATLRKMLSKSTPAEKKNHFWSLLNNGGKVATYHLYSNWVMVEVDSKMVTCYQDNPARYAPKILTRH